ncbi:MAG: methyltransferase domain-containing protein [Deltaproteobacteria bacterium]|jgi:trans-aconitate 2-methyltransferase|nr:methyltransferase domain-containing protein [Deltaproteobacteria bacterium]
MDNWNPNKYLQFKNERTQPAIDLVEKIDINEPTNIIDIGCGPGNSTQILINKWPNSMVIGLDSSINMIEKARKDYPYQMWIHDNAENIHDDKKYSIVFSNASLQWMEDHKVLIPKLWKIVSDNGVFAAQIPKFETMPINSAIQNVLRKELWEKSIKNNFWANKTLRNLDYYYEIFSTFTEEIIVWETHYFHILPSMQGIIDFIHSTALKPYLEELKTDKEKQKFENDILKECRKYYKEQSDGKVLFPFKRMFMIAYKN